MKKLIFGLAVLGAAVFGSTASAQNFQVGDQFVQAGIGFGSAYIGNGLNGGLPPVHVSYEYGFKEKIGIGGLLGITSAKSGPLFGGGEYKYSYTIVGARGTYHFYEKDKLDCYGGVMLGYNFAKVKYTGNNAFLGNNIAAAGGFAFGGFVGARYFVNEKFHVMAEAGYSIAFISVGAGIKL